jgi:hypothetical protein
MKADQAELLALYARIDDFGQTYLLLEARRLSQTRTRPARDQRKKPQLRLVRAQQPQAQKA